MSFLQSCLLTAVTTGTEWVTNQAYVMLMFRPYLPNRFAELSQGLLGLRARMAKTIDISMAESYLH